ncbi:Conserved_hypothetical protein [Hexamita inflata]|uniref:Uncharacterized protein n=1 Tax=Hexamita inflata TaxID=28002 RepID=A0AA86U6W1_9EUKA|nr:Conserved hypothetical protein [Hexamita inflata]
MQQSSENHATCMVLSKLAMVSQPDNFKQIINNQVSMSLFQSSQNFVNELNGQKLVTSQELNLTHCGYFGIAYLVNDQVYIAHRGTVKNSPANLAADLLILKRQTPQFLLDEAQKYTESVKQSFKNHNVIHTGFSLGGYIAQQLIQLDADAVAVTFDAPGIKLNNDQQLNEKCVNYVTNPNDVNTCNIQAGTVRQLEAYDREPMKLVNIWSHNMNDLLLKQSELFTQKILKYKDVNKWPHAIYQQIPVELPKKADIFKGLLGKIIGNIYDQTLLTFTAQYDAEQKCFMGLKFVKYEPENVEYSENTL